VADKWTQTRELYGNCTLFSFSSGSSLRIHFFPFSQDGGTFEVPITLIAIHHGLLSLPRVAVEALPESEGEQTTEDGVAAVPSTETHQVHGAEKVLILPRGGRTTYVVSLGEEEGEE
jgi:hypothetical protein